MIVLAPARTVTGVTKSSRFRSNSKEGNGVVLAPARTVKGATVIVLIVRGVPTENYQSLVLKLTQIVLIVPPTADTFRTVMGLPFSCYNLLQLVPWLSLLHHLLLFFVFFDFPGIF